MNNETKRKTKIEVAAKQEKQNLDLALGSGKEKKGAVSQGSFLGLFSRSMSA